jgi:hypothetical protein
MDQISKTTPNPKCRLFEKTHLLWYLAAGVYLSEAPYPLPPVTHCMNTCTPVLIHIGKGGGGVDEPVRRLEWR